MSTIGSNIDLQFVVDLLGLLDFLVITESLTHTIHILINQFVSMRDMTRGPSMR